MEKQNNFFDGETNVDEKIKKLREEEGYIPPFEEVKRVVVNKKNKEGRVISEVFISLQIEKKEEKIRVENRGDINTLHVALRSVLSKHYKINNIKVEEIIHHAIGSGTEAFAQVILSMRNHKREWRVSGKSESVIEAGWQALLRGYEYALSFYRTRREKW